MEKYDTIVFVCTGNTCRSPMAEAMLKDRLSDGHVSVMSRGLMVFGESPANELAVEVMKEKDIDISHHVAKPFDKDEINGNALVLTMTMRHKTVLTQHGFKGEIYGIKEFVGMEGDVKDPYGGGINTYRSCVNELEEIIERLGGLL